jgi:hypothetical protein
MLVYTGKYTALYMYIAMATHNMLCKNKSSSRHDMIVEFNNVISKLSFTAEAGFFVVCWLLFDDCGALLLLHTQQ